MRSLIILSTGVLLAAVQAACEYTGDRPNNTAPISSEPHRSTANAARIIERQSSGRSSGPGYGTSMQPVFGDNVYFVIAPINFEDLRSGMLIAYRNLGGARVVHRIVAKEGKYWTVEGINNRYDDADYVTKENLIGIVYGTFHANQ